MLYQAKITDTFGGEANYCWKREYLIEAKNKRGAINKLAKHYGSGWHYVGCDRYDMRGACICCFLVEADEYNNTGEVI